MVGYSNCSSESEVSVKEIIFCFNRMVIKKHVLFSAGISSITLTHRHGSGRPLTAKAQVQFEATLCGIFGGQRGNTTGFLSVLRSSLVISGSPSPRHGASSGCGWRNGLQYGG